MRVRTDDLFRASEALRKRAEAFEQRVYEMQGHVKALEQALLTANTDNVALARRVQYVENKLRELSSPDQFTPPEG